MSELTAGFRLERYYIERRLGAGGMGVVYLARDMRLHRPVAIKMLPADVVDPTARERLQDEGLTLSRLSHPNIAALFDIGGDSTFAYLVMEYVPGETLDAIIDRGALPAARVACLGAQLARGLAAAHATSVVHRDVKPGNIRITPQGLLKILDFGVAIFGGSTDVATTTLRHCPRTFAGTLRYMSPEVLRGTEVTPRSDIFSAGAVLYEMASGRPRFEETHPVRLIESILDVRRPRAVQTQRPIDRPLAAIIARALDRDPNRRFKSSSELAEALEALVRVPLEWRFDSTRGQADSWRAWFSRKLLSRAVGALGDGGGGESWTAVQGHH